MNGEPVLCKSGQRKSGFGEERRNKADSFKVFNLKVSFFFCFANHYVFAVNGDFDAFVLFVTVNKKNK